MLMLMIVLMLMMVMVMILMKGRIAVKLDTRNVFLLLVRVTLVIILGFLRACTYMCICLLGLVACTGAKWRHCECWPASQQLSAFSVLPCVLALVCAYACKACFPVSAGAPVKRGSAGFN